MALNSDTYIHGILYCSKHLNTSPLNIPEKRLIGLMLDFSDVEPAELISVIEVSYNHNLPVLVKNMDLDQLAKAYSKMALYDAYRLQLLFIWFRVHSMYVEQVSGTSHAPLLQMSAPKVFENWVDTTLRFGTSKFFEQKSNCAWLTNQIRTIWNKNSLENDLNAEVCLRSGLYFVLENEEDTENIDSFLDISFNYRVPQNVLSQEVSFRTQLEKRLRLLGAMSKICIEIWSRALLTPQEAELFLASTSMKPTSPRIQKSSPKPTPKPSSVSKPPQTKPAPKTNPASKTKTASTKVPARSQPSVKQPPQSTSPSVPSQNSNTGWSFGYWLLAVAIIVLFVGVVFTGAEDSTYTSTESQSESVKPASQVASKKPVRRTSSSKQKKIVSPPKTTTKVESDTQEVHRTLPPEQKKEPLPEPISSEKNTESLQELKERVCEKFVIVARKVIDDCRLKWRGEGPEFFIVSFGTSPTIGFNITDFEFDPPHKKKRRTTNCLNGYERKRFHRLFDSNEAKYILDKNTLQCKM